MLISAYKDEVVASRAPDVGVHAFIEKPFSVKDLTKSLSLLIEKRNAINRYNSWIMIPLTSYPPPPALPLFVSPS